MRAFALIGALILGSAFLCSAASAQTITGTVSGPGGPVIGADIDLINGSGVSVALTGDTTDALGNFTAVATSALPSGTYTVLVEPVVPGLLEGSTSVSITGAGTFNVGTVNLASGWVLTGRVIDPNGSGVAGINIDLDGDNVGLVTNLWGDFTDANGDFNVTFPPVVDEYRVFVEGTAVQYFSDQFDIVITSAADPDLNMGTIVLPPGVFLSGTILRESGTPLVGIDMQVIDPANGTAFTTTNDDTDAAGNFNVLVPVGTWTIQFRQLGVNGNPPAPPLFAGLELEGVDCTANSNIGTLVMRNAFLLSGTVRAGTAGGAAIANAALDIIDAITGETLFINNSSSGAGGTFQVVAPTGPTILEVSAPVGVLQAPVTVPLNLTANLNLGNVVLPNGVPLSGTVVNSALVGIGGVDIDLVTSPAGTRVPTVNDDTAANGTFSVVTVTGTYDVEVRPAFASGYAPTLLPAVNVAGATNLGNITLADGFAVTGTVTNELGAPLQGVEVSFVDTTSGLPVYSFSNSTAVDGTYAVRQPAGTYNITYTPAAGSGLPTVIESNVLLSTDIVIDVELGPPPAVTGLNCLASDLDATLGWSLGAADYDSIDVLRDGTVIASLAGSAVGYDDLAVGIGNYVYDVIANRQGFASTAASCQVNVTGQQSFIRGDTNNTGTLNLTDVLTILNYSFNGGVLLCLDTGDLDDNGSITITDPILLLQYLFAGGAPPAAPFPDPGPDPTPDSLGCP